MNDSLFDKSKGNTQWLHEARKVYLAGAQQKLAALDSAITGLKRSPDSHLHEHELRMLLHNLVGSGASYGFQAITDTARTMLDCLRLRRDDDSPVANVALVALRGQYRRLQRIFKNAKP